MVKGKQWICKNNQMTFQDKLEQKKILVHGSRENYQTNLIGSALGHVKKGYNTLKVRLGWQHIL